MNQNEIKMVNDLEKFGDYALLDKMSELQKKVIAAVRNTGKAGKMSVVISYKRKGNYDIVINSKVTPTIPEIDMESTVLFVDKNNELHDGNPDQIKTHENVSSIGKKKVNEV